MAIEQIVVGGGADLDPYIDDMVRVYDRAFREPPYNHNRTAASAFRQTLETHRAYPDFEAVLLVELGRVAGLIYGHTNGPDQWWCRQIAPHLTDAQLAQFAGAWVIVELAVDPTDRRRGLGQRLLDVSLHGKSNGIAVLSTMVAESAAMRLYERNGFTPMVAEFQFLGSAGHWCVLARPLPVKAGHPRPYGVAHSG